MNIVFMGTPVFATVVLEMLLREGYHVAGVVTQPDKPQGRKKMVVPSPVKIVAEHHNLPVIQPQRIRDKEAIAQLSQWKPDLIITAAFGQIIPKIVLDMPVRGCINVHGSLLPKYRGGAPIQRAIMEGETMTGVTLMFMAEGLDTGDMIAQVEIPIAREDTSGTVFQKLSHAGAELLRQQMPHLLVGEVTGVRQDEQAATYAPNLRREDERIDWGRTAEQLYNQIRGLVPFSGAFALWSGEVLKIWKASDPLHNVVKTLRDHSAPLLVPGTILSVDTSGIEVCTGKGSLWITEVQPAGKKRMSAIDFARGGTVQKGKVLL